MCHEVYEGTGFQPFSGILIRMPENYSGFEQKPILLKVPRSYSSNLPIVENEIVSRTFLCHVFAFSGPKPVHFVQSPIFLLSGRNYVLVKKVLHIMRIRERRGQFCCTVRLIPPKHRFLVGASPNRLQHIVDQYISGRNYANNHRRSFIYS